jgi:hypothetical protein
MQLIAQVEETPRDKVPVAQARMYARAKTWSPFKGCGFDCNYCEPSFKRQARRRKRSCDACYRYTPHYHPERLSKIPSAEIVFVCGNADIAFCKQEFVGQVIGAIKAHRPRLDKVYYLQSKKPECLEPFLPLLPATVILVTTLETNRDEGYGAISKAPVPSERYRQFASLKYPRKIATIEPVMDFDVDIFAQWIITINPEYVWLGFNSHPGNPDLPEPSAEKLREFMTILMEHHIPIKGKDLRGMNLPGVTMPHAVKQSLAEEE